MEKAQSPFQDDVVHKQLMIRVCTWNVGESSPVACSPDMLDDWIFGRNKRQANTEPDIIAIGLQEVDMSVKALWLACCGVSTAAGLRWSSALDDHLHNYDLLASNQLMGMELLIFSRKQITSQVTCESDTACSGWFGLFANKGGMATRVTIFNKELNETTRFCIINCHFAAKEEKVARRNQDHDTLLRDINFFTQPRDILDHDFVFWAGDFNYRLYNVSHQQIEALTSCLSEPSEIRDLMANHDQLRHQMSRGRVFRNFTEPAVSFPPSYKVLKHCSDRRYDPKRVPSYCDRILHYTYVVTTKGNDAENRSSSPLLDIEMSSACGSVTSPTGSAGSGITSHPIPIFETDQLDTVTTHSTDGSQQTDPATDPILCFEYISTFDNAGSDHRAVSALYRVPSVTVIEEFEEAC
eukprot:TRINITY_DN15806_c0_g1_i1.p1 TRINITY_DN15806_c0_g1~~TRINITY_DN15806_c0_g1_i1.p1  ORF type:complete len:410 (+),score=50.81 TRINITY_DN15806_c0_g1_i1:47-1276(+)